MFNGDKPGRRAAPLQVVAILTAPQAVKGKSAGRGDQSVTKLADHRNLGQVAADKPTREDLPRYPGSTQSLRLPEQ